MEIGALSLLRITSFSTSLKTSLSRSAICRTSIELAGSGPVAKLSPCTFRSVSLLQSLRPAYQSSLLRKSSEFTGSTIRPLPIYDSGCFGSGAVVHSLCCCKRPTENRWLSICRRHRLIEQHAENDPLHRRACGNIYCYSTSAWIRQTAPQRGHYLLLGLIHSKNGRGRSHFATRAGIARPLRHVRAACACALAPSPPARRRAGTAKQVPER